MKTNFFIKLLLISLLLFSCSLTDDVSGVPDTSVIKVTEIYATDSGNENNSSDITIKLKITKGIPEIKKMYVLFSKESTSLHSRDVPGLADRVFWEITPNESIDEQIQEILYDSHGDLIKEGTHYRPHILIKTNNYRTYLVSGKESFQLQNETLVTDLKITSGNIMADEDIALDDDFNLYVNGGGSNESITYKINPQGEVQEFSTSLKYPVGCTVGPDKTVYVTNFRSTDIFAIDAYGVENVLVSDPQLVGGGGIIINNDGEIFNTFFAVKKIFKISNNKVEEFVSSSLLDGPVGLTYDKVRDHIYVSNFLDGKIFRVEADGTLNEVAKSPSSIGHVSYANDHLHVTGVLEHKVFRLNTAGDIVDVIGTGAVGTVNGTAATASFTNPNGIEATPDGKFAYITSNGIVRKIIFKRP
ncbi:YncE family protein [Aquimarina sp. RZ0]|uniref:YncE family protein n=1 Tax=Aquimarina sp. RZ0 TaxID=2607730 RepID=UPI0011F29511|nr:YncE family protein [Aquimarina sp. RZ0]KAA1245260.1 YncE family protein [Aquimarina sp. RZ0]